MGAEHSDPVNFSDRDREYKAAFDDLSDEEREAMRRVGVFGPELAVFETKDPEFSEERAGDVDVTVDGTKHDDVVWLLQTLERYKSPKLAIRVLLKAMKVAPFAQMNDDAIGRPFGFKKQTVSILRRRMGVDLGMKLDAGKGDDASSAYRRSNKNNRRIFNHGT